MTSAGDALMVAHVIDIHTQHEWEGQDKKPTGRFRYRWRCSCGKAGARWYEGSAESGAHATAAHRARSGGARHVAAMERGR
jgi:hypothetical protein